MIQLEYSLVFQMELQVVMDIYIIYFAIRKKGGLTDGVLNSLVRYVMKYLIGKSHHFNPSTLKISLGIFLTIFHTILIKLVWGFGSGSTNGYIVRGNSALVALGVEGFIIFL